MQKRRISHCESKSLWNYTLSPGWCDEEVSILKKALQKFGIGKWKKIMQSNCLPGKSIGQIYMQTQRLIGQQSLGEFMGLSVDLEKVFLDNMRKTNVVRKNNCIINTGDNPTKEERKRRIEENFKKYGLTAEEVKNLKLPKFKKSNYNLLTLDEIESDKLTTIEKLNHLDKLKKILERKINSIKNSYGEGPVIISLEKTGVTSFKLI